MKHAALLAGLVAFVVACKKSDSPQPSPQQPVQKIGSGVAPPEEVAKVAGSGSAAGSGSGEADAWSTPQPPKADPIGKPFFWSIEKGGKTSYLLGTMHIGIDAEQRLPKVVFDKLDAATTFAMETDTTDPAIAGLGKRKSGGTLKNDLGPVYWKKLEAVVGANVAASINELKPMVAATLVSLRGLPATPPMDGVLHARATRQNKKVVFLEPASTQAAVLEKHMSVKALKIMLDDPEKGIAQTKKLLEAYLAGDDATFIKLSAEQREDALKNGYTAAEYDEFMEDINYKRNRSWIPIIEKINAEGPGFIAVGALHLIGEKSVLDLLAKQGYKVTRVTP